MLTLGIDDAGRGPLIGPMILAGVLLNLEQEKILKKYPIRDSKTVVHSTRIKLAPIIKDNSLAHKIAKAFPNEIDNSLQTGTNLNTLEAIKTAEIINSINTNQFQKEKIKVIVDCPSTNTSAWRNTLISYISHTKNLEVLCEHKADVNHFAASAASILAKVAREEEVEKIKQEFRSYGDTGSGYPADPITKKFLIKHGQTLKDSGIFRKTWATWKELFPEKGQSTLESF